MLGKCPRYLTSQHFRSPSCFTRREESSGGSPACPLLPLIWAGLRLLNFTWFTNASSLTPSHSGALLRCTEAASPPSALSFALLRKVSHPRPSRSPQFLKPTAPGPCPYTPRSWPLSPSPGWPPTRCNSLLPAPPSSTRRSGDQPGRI